MKKMTEENLKAAFAGESQAHMKYLAFSRKAEAEGKPNVARLFAAASYAEQVHATAHLRVLKGVGGTADNLGAAMAGEAFEVEEMYPAYIAAADAQEEKAAKTAFHRAMDAEVVHHQLYSRAKQAVEAGRDAEIGPVWVCEACGHTVEGTEPPDQCPLCQARKDKYVRF
ncbi:MAG TPA: rubrerythrin family protein [Acidobacteriota bacterium]|nr:rubrerythrin family protein [Acidobacteriota bacterium]HQM61678.1 rubrerythrin family protein [Acidobacteriota bacterium]